MRSLQIALAVARKDLRSEWRGRELLPALATFVLLALVIANFAFDLNGASVPRLAPGILWLVLVFVGLVAFGRSFAGEKERGSLEAMLLTPAPAGALFAGKAGAAGLVLLATEAVLLVGMALFLGAPLSAAVIAITFAASLGIAALGSLFAALVAQTRAKELLLPVLVLPLWLPFVVLGGRALQEAFAGQAMRPGPSLLLLDLGVLFWIAAVLAARFVLDD
ncbi:MAG: heme exporter protein CcmB [Candidatus Dormibacteraeota bacterium]|uniref:Heme exporter protein CcmB n=1 Tax=Candidatus Dormiibacter inghamiae TaxID=3127013 RepID=A0A934KEL9_9BACT|nr:heme exporter protein CcmB [Candidatus Dormibacteraeota bacterium]MBJ7607002.1 heme exporter protein CcmB [Candidatus Dormibacteraeota bacterium]